MARISLELGSRGTAPLRVADRDPDRRLHRARCDASSSSAPAGASTRSCARSPRSPRAPEAAARRRATPASPPTPRSCADATRRRPAGAGRRRARERGVDLVVVGPEAPLVAGLADALRGRGHRRASARAPPRPRLEGSKAYAKEVMHAAGVPTARHAVVDDGRRRPRSRSAAATPVVIKADGLAAGKGVVIAPTRPRRGDALAGDARRAPLRRHARCVVEEFLEGDELSLLALCDGAARCRWRPRATTSASATATAARTPAGWARSRRCRRSPTSCVDAHRAEVHQPVRRRAGAARHAVPRRALRRADAHRRRARGCSSSTCASAIPRRRPCCRGCAATCSTCSSARRARAAWPAPSLEWDARSAVTRRARLARLPGVVVLRRRHRGPRPRARRRSRSRTRAPPRAATTWSPPAVACST